MQTVPHKLPILDGAERPPVYLVDCTLREGDQTPGVWLRIEDKLLLLELMTRMGLQRFDAGMPEVGPEEQAFFRQAMKRFDGRLELGASIRLQTEAVQKAVSAGCHALFLICPVSPLHRMQRLGLSLDALKRRLEQVLNVARPTGKRLFLVAEDAARCPMDELISLLQVGMSAGIEICFLCDTVGIATTRQIELLVTGVKQSLPELPLGVHCHNDFGLATANTLAAVEAGIDYPTVCVNGIGERSGNASLAEVLLGCERLLNRATGVEALGLPTLSATVERLTGLLVPPHQPVVGRNAFRHESGIHVDGILKQVETYEPIPPTVIGRQRQFSFGKHTGRATLRMLAEQHGVHLSEEQLSRALADLQAHGPEQSREQFQALREALAIWEQVAQGISEATVVELLRRVEAQR